ncbi:hypothetical protein [Ilumatobacter sp.]|uniref:hypothetical protein n=1 Tax=Ilumatobacter sp. TaxID=1967498 RepID=UPI0037526D78
MLVFLVGEGPTDIGDLSSAPSYRNGGEGFFQPLIRTMLGDCEFDGQKVTALGKRKIRGAKTALGRKAAIAAVLAEALEADILVYSMDADHAFKRRRAELVQYLQGQGMPFAVAVAKETVEAWVMGDPAAVAAIEPDVAPPPKPEHLWGKPKEPDSDHPKQFLRRLVDRNPDREDFAAAGEAALPSQLCQRCPESFKPFADEISSFSGHLPCTP